MARNQMGRTLLALACLFATARAASADCGEVADRILKPLADWLAECEAGKKEYARLEEKELAAQKDWLAKLAEGKAFLEKEAKKEMDGLSDVVDDCCEAIEAIHARVGREIEGARVEEKRLRALGDASNADGCVRNAEKLRKSLEDKSAAGVSKKIHKHDSIAGFEKYIADTEQKITDIQTAVTKGEYGLSFIPVIGREGSRKSIEKLEEAAKAEIAVIEKGEKVLFVKPLRNHFARTQVDDVLSRAKDALAEARRKIRDGDFPVLVQGRGELSRNDVQRMIAEATATLYRAEDAWGKGAWAAMNRTMGRSVTNGELETEKRRWTAATLVEREEREIKAAESRLAEIEKALAEHLKLRDDSLAQQKKNLEETLRPLLEKTPCGKGKLVGDDPGKAEFESNLDRLDAISEDESEIRDRRDRYIDKVLMEDDGTLHGDLRAGFLNATDDLGLASPEMKTLRDVIDEIDALGDSFGVIKGVGDFGTATEDLRAFAKAMDGIDSAAPDAVTRAAELLRTWGPKLEKMFTEGMLSEGTLLRAIAILRDNKAQPELLEKLAALRQRAELLWRSGLSGLVRAGIPAGLDGAKLLAGARSAIAGGPAWVAQTWNNMGPFDRLCFGITALAAYGSYEKRVEELAKVRPMDWKDRAEAAVRTTTELAIDFAISGCPPAAAFELATIFFFKGAELKSGDKSWGDAVFSTMLKNAAGAFYDGVVVRAAEMAAGAGEQLLTKEILDNVSLDRLKRSLAIVELRIESLTPGRPTAGEEKTLLRMRERFRRAIRAKT